MEKWHFLHGWDNHRDKTKHSEAVFIQKTNYSSEWILQSLLHRGIIKAVKTIKDNWHRDKRGANNAIQCQTYYYIVGHKPFFYFRFHHTVLFFPPLTFVQSHKIIYKLPLRQIMKD